MKEIPSGWRNNRYAAQQVDYLIAEEDLNLSYIYRGSNNFLFNFEKDTYNVCLDSVSTSHVILRVDGVKHDVALAVDGNTYYMHSPMTGNVVMEEKERFPTRDIDKEEGGYEAPMPSQIIKVLVAPEKEVVINEPLLVISSMKMENTITANASGVVKEIYVEEGQSVEAGYLLLKVE